MLKMKFPPGTKINRCCISPDQNVGLKSACPRQLSEIKYVKAGLEHVEGSEFPEEVFL